MKTHLAFLAALALASSGAAFAKGKTPPPPAPEPEAPAACDVCAHDVVVKGPQIQVTAMKHSASIATANGNNSAAYNNMSSNTKGVLINAGVTSTQITALDHTGVLAKAENGSYANNNLASNIGSVGVGANQLQVVAASGSYMGAKANNGARAIQNFSSNNACVDCR